MVYRRDGCRYEHCDCVDSSEELSCMMGQWNKFDRPAEEEKEKQVTEEFRKAMKEKDYEKAHELFPKLKTQW